MPVHRDPYSALRRAHAQGLRIQSEQGHAGSGNWVDCHTPNWSIDAVRYRVAPPDGSDLYYGVKLAYAQGKKIQYRCRVSGRWKDVCNNPDWHSFPEDYYRIKPYDQVIEVTFISLGAPPDTDARSRRDTLDMRLLERIREWLKMNDSIRATDPNDPMLLSVRPDGSAYGGVTITYGTEVTAQMEDSIQTKTISNCYAGRATPEASTPEQRVLERFRKWLRAGASIRAIHVDRVLEILSEDPTIEHYFYAGVRLGYPDLPERIPDVPLIFTPTPPVRPTPTPPTPPPTPSIIGVAESLERLCQRQERMLDIIRGWLRQGASIRATDPNGRILELLPDGSCHGGLTVTGGADAVHRDIRRNMAHTVTYPDSPVLNGEEE